MPSTATSILDGLSTSVAVKAPCRTVATSNITLAGLQTISGYTTVENDRVLVKGQTDPIDNGIYMASTGSWARAKDADGNRDLVQGTRVLVRSTTIDGAEYELTTANPIVIGTTALTFALRYGANATFDQTESEIAAGVTPTSYLYPPGDVRRYGAVGDGSTNNTTALRNCFSAVGVGGTITFEPAGVYMVDSSAVNGILLTGKTNFVIRGNGATIKVIDGESVAGNHEVVTFISCTDGYIENLNADANRDTRTPAEVGAHTIYISTSCARLHFKNVRSDNAVCDGWLLSSTSEATQATYPTDITLEDCHADNAARNNLSAISSVRLKVIRGRYTNANGIEPEYGIDIEPDASTTHANQDVIIDGVEVTGNAGYGLAIARSGGSVLNERVKFRNISGTDNDEGLISVNAVTDIDIDGVNCWGHSAATRGLIDIGPTAASNVSIKNVEFRNITAAGAGDYCIYIHNGVSGRVSIDGVKANAVDCSVIYADRRVSLSNVDIVDCSKDPAIMLVAGSHSVARRITVDDCAGRAIYVTATDCEVADVTVIDADSTTAAIHFDTGSTGAVARNISIYQSVSIPGGAVGVYFAAAPKLVSNVHAQSAGTDYTAATAFNFAGGLASSKVFDCTPHPFMAAVTWNPASVADGDTVNQTVTVNGVAVAAGWFVQVSPGIAPEGLCVGGYVDGTNQVRIVANNNTGAPIDLASSSWQVYCEKR